MKQKRELTKTAKVLLTLFTVIDLLPRPFEGKTAYFKRQLHGHIPYKTYLAIINKLESKGLIKIFKDNNRQFIKLTKSGVLETLFVKAKFDNYQKWDGKWRMIIFDIPEEARASRDNLRFLLKINGFIQIQKSVYLSPYPFNREALRYLRETGLDKFIRVFRIDEADKTQDLKRHFNLN